MIRFEANTEGDGVEVKVEKEKSTILEMAAVAMAAKQILDEQIKKIAKEEHNGQCN